MARPMARSARAILTLVWLAFFVIQVAIVAYFKLAEWIEGDAVAAVHLMSRSTPIYEPGVTR